MKMEPRAFIDMLGKVKTGDTGELEAIVSQSEGLFSANGTCFQLRLSERPAQRQKHHEKEIYGGITMNELKVFNNPEFGKVRTVEINGEPWLVGKDVAAALGYSDTDQALRKHVDDEDKLTRQIDGVGQNRSMTIINESGLYSLVLSSKLPGAKKFKRWVTSEVLPSIRKTGQYTARPMTDYQMESIRVRKAQLLERLAKEYDGTYRQVLQAHATKELTGEYLLPLPYIGEKTYSAQEIGEKLGISANKVGMLANRNHLKTKQYGAWVNDVAKNCPGKEVPSFRYYESIVPVLKTIMSEQ